MNEMLISDWRFKTLLTSVLFAAGGYWLVSMLRDWQTVSQTLREILALIVPQGWFLAVTPGTRDVTVGGAIANDVHGKNHHVAGSFGHPILHLELLRSSGERLLCNPPIQPELFQATIGGLGLTGLITWAEIQLIPIANEMMAVETTRFANLDEFWMLNTYAETQWPYTIAWIDCLARGKHQGRGVLMAGRHAAPQAKPSGWREHNRNVPFTPPLSLVNPLSLKAFNTLYWHKARSGQGSFLAVLKTFALCANIGLMSFPMPGATLALDFPNLGTIFKTAFSQWTQFAQWIDPAFSSDFWRRVTHE